MLEPRRRWEGSRKKAKVSNRTTGNPAVRDYRGASGNVAMVEMRSRLAYRKSESGNPPPTAGAPELYPNRRHGGTVNPPCNRKSGNGNPPPKAGRALLLSQRDDGLRPQDDEGLGPAGPNLPQGGPEQPVEGGQRWSRPFALEHSYLLSKGEDFESGATRLSKNTRTAARMFSYCGPRVGQSPWPSVACHGLPTSSWA